MTNKLWGKERRTFRKVLRNIRKEAEFTQSELAKKLSKPQSYISKYENGERRLDYIEVYEICHECGYNIEEFSRLYEKQKKISETA